MADRRLDAPSSGYVRRGGWPDFGPIHTVLPGGLAADEDGDYRGLIDGDTVPENGAVTRAVR
jgi:hypothetical protein